MFFKTVVDLPGQVPVFVIPDALDEYPNNVETGHGCARRRRRRRWEASER